MRTLRQKVVPAFSLFLFLGAGCGGAASQQAAPMAAVPVAPSPPEPQVAPVPPGAPAVADAPMPGELLAFARWRDPRRTVAAIAAEAGVASAAVDELAAAAAPALVRELLGDRVEVEPFAALIDWSASIDAAVITEGDPARFRTRTAFSIGLRSLPRALAALRTRAQQRPEGYWPIEGASGDDDGQSPHCGVFAAAGPAPARLVCGQRARDVKVLGSYLSSTFARKAHVGLDLHGEVHLRSLLDKVGPGLAAKAKALPMLASSQRLGVPAFDDALMEAAAALADEAGRLLQDVDAFEFDAGYDADAGIRIQAKAAFAGASSWSVQRLIDAPPLGAAAPELVGRVPRASSSVAYSHRGDPSAFAGVTRVLRGLIEGGLASVPFGSAADRRAIAALVRLEGRKHVPTVRAQGRFKDAAPPTSLQDAVGGLLGWYLAGIEDEPKLASAWLQDLVKVYNRPAVQRWMKSTLKEDAKFLPTLKSVAAPRALGPGALDVELRVPELDDPLAAWLGGTSSSGGEAPRGKGSAKRASVSVHLLLMPDGERTWYGLATDRDKMADLMARAKGKLPGPDALANDAASQAFLREAHRSSAFVTLRGSLGLFETLVPMLAFLPGDVGAIGTGFAAGMQQMPNGGVTPVTLSSDVQGGARPRLSFALRLPRGTIQDFGALVRRMLSELGPTPSFMF